MRADLLLLLSLSAPLPQRQPVPVMPRADPHWNAAGTHCRGPWGGPFVGAPAGEDEARRILSTRFPCREATAEAVALADRYRAWLVASQTLDIAQRAVWWDEQICHADDVAQPWRDLASAWHEHDTCLTPYWVGHFLERLEGQLGPDRYSRGEMPSVIPAAREK